MILFQTFLKLAASKSLFSGRNVSNPAWVRCKVVILSKLNSLKSYKQNSLTSIITPTKSQFCLRNDLCDFLQVHALYASLGTIGKVKQKAFFCPEFSKIKITVLYFLYIILSLQNSCGRSIVNLCCNNRFVLHFRTFFCLLIIALLCHIPVKFQVMLRFTLFL